MSKASVAERETTYTRFSRWHKELLCPKCGWYFERSPRARIEGYGTREYVSLTSYCSAGRSHCDWHGRITVCNNDDPPQIELMQIAIRRLYELGLHAGELEELVSILDRLAEI